MGTQLAQGQSGKCSEFQASQVYILRPCLQKRGDKFKACLSLPKRMSTLKTSMSPRILEFWDLTTIQRQLLRWTAIPSLFSVFHMPTVYRQRASSKQITVERKNYILTKFWKNWLEGPHTVQTLTGKTWVILRENPQESHQNRYLKERRRKPDKLGGRPTP